MAKKSKTKDFEDLNDEKSTLSTGFAIRSDILKVVGYMAAAEPLAKACIADDLDEGVIELDARTSIGQYIDAAKQQRVWNKEARLSEGAV